MTTSTCKTIVGAAGVAIILLALGALLLPLQEGIPGRMVVGGLLIAAGLVELVAALVRVDHRPSAAVAAVASLVAGVRLAFDPTAGFFTVLNLVILWLVVRSAALGFGAVRGRPKFRPWIAVAAVTDLLLAIALLVGLPIAVLVVGLFGSSSPIVATFAWVFGFSFIATGTLLIAISRIREDGSGS